MPHMIKIFAILTFTGTLSVVLYDILTVPWGFKSITWNYASKKDNWHNRNYISFVVDTPVCQIPNYDANDRRLHQILEPGATVNCKTTVSLTYRKGTSVYVNKTAVSLSKFRDVFHSCVYNPIFRPLKGKDHNYFKYLNHSKSFDTSIKVEEEFIQVRCFDKKNFTIFTNFYAFAIEKEAVRDRLRKLSKLSDSANGRIKKAPNVLMLGTDSVSRLNSVRYMSKTRLYLLRELGSFEFLGYNKVGLNTFPNIVPMTSGKHLQELPWNESMSGQSLDKHEFIWKRFSDHGYRTLYAEDYPAIAIFDYLKAGFRDIPTDYYNRPLAVAMAADDTVWHSNKFCMVDRTESELILDYILQFLAKFHKEPFFAFSFLTKLTHDSLSLAAFADDIYFEFLKLLNENGFLRNTILFFFSDHGMRYGAIRDSFVGAMEARMPMMHLVIPKQMSTRYPHIARNLDFNTMKLSSPFDVYETLLDILNFSRVGESSSTSKWGVSLFNRIPETRNCSSAGIPQEFCTCAQYEDISTTTDMAKTISGIVVKNLNKIIEDSISLCHRLVFENIKSLAKREPVEKSTGSGRKLTMEYYIVKITTVPGSALFEATLEYDTNRKSYRIVGDINRINSYGEQSHCVNEATLKNYCFCRAK